ncbi:MAG: hypothetical protein HYR94_17665 [Chloroflexi bacterium]|nr:hypothetical protein [Chloroflexota bacterium]
MDDTLDESDETVNLTLSAPTNATLGAPNPATLTIVDDDAVPTVQFSAPNYNVNENGGTAPIMVTLSAVSALTVTVDYTTSNGIPPNGAAAGSDYIPISGTLTFASLQTSQTFNVAIIDDAGTEPAETLNLNLSNPVNAAISGPNPATLTIADNDALGGPCTTALYPPPLIVEIGPPDCRWTDLGSGTIITDVTTAGGPPISRSGNGNFDLVYYERESAAGSGMIAMDRVRILISTDGTTWYPVFDWGDGVLDTNTNIGQAPPPGPYGGGGPPPPGNEGDNVMIPLSIPPLYQSSAGGPISGIAIDIDAPLTVLGAPAGPYPFIQIIGNNQAEVDSIEVLP